MRVPPFDLPGVLRRVRRLADMSQRELAAAIDSSKTAVAAAESGTSGMDARLLARAAGLADLRLVLVDSAGAEVAGMSDEGVRDKGDRRFPAHLDTRYGDDGWWYDVHRYGRPRPWYTFDRARRARDRDRAAHGTPDDHQLPQPGDAPWERAEARKLERRRQQATERERAFLAGEFRLLRDLFECTCPPECDELEDWGPTPIHAEHCPCRCDVD